MATHRKTDIDNARDELMSHIHRCGVLKASSEHQAEWMTDTIAYLGELYPGLSDSELTQLEEIGTRFCQPVIPHGAGHSALTVQEDAEASDVDVGEESNGSERPAFAGV